MKRIQPSFYDDFACTASACTDSCCIGWEIDIDPDTHLYYQGVPGDMGNRLKRGIDAGQGAPHFTLGGNERCPFLSNSNLCDVYTHLGEEHLCDICKQHPRFYEWYGDRVEAGLGLCCEEACRLLLSSSAPLTFLTRHNEAAPDDFDGDEDWLETLLPARKRFIHHMQRRTQPPFARLALLLPEMVDLQDTLEGFQPVPFAADALPPPNYAPLIAACRAMEAMDGNWEQLVDNLERSLSDLQPDPTPDYVYEHTIVYLLYRWFLKASFDGDIWGKMRLITVFSVLLSLLLRQGIVPNPEHAIRILSKQIEYSKDNTDLLQSDEAFTLPYLLSLLK